MRSRSARRLRRPTAARRRLRVPRRLPLLLASSPPPTSLLSAEKQATSSWHAVRSSASSRLLPMPRASSIVFAPRAAVRSPRQDAAPGRRPRRTRALGGRPGQVDQQPASVSHDVAFSGRQVGRHDRGDARIGGVRARPRDVQSHGQRDDSMGRLVHRDGVIMLPSPIAASGRCRARGDCRPPRSASATVSDPRRRQPRG